MTDELPLESSDIIAIEPSPDTQPGTERGDLFRAMAFEADRRVKELEAENAGLKVRVRSLEDSLAARHVNSQKRHEEVQQLVAAADRELGHALGHASKHDRVLYAERAIKNARAALKKAKEVG